MRALFSPTVVFEELALRPGPAFAEAALAGATWGVGASALAILVIQMKLPANAGLGIFTMILAFVGLATASAIGVVLASGLFHGISIVSGGSGSFNRSIQSVAHLAILLPLLAVIPWFSNPLLWILPTVWITWISVNAIVTLHDADSGQAWMVAGALGLAAAGGQVAFRDDVSRVHFSVEDRITIYAVDPKAATRYSHESAKTLRAPKRTGRGALPAMPENPMNVGGSPHQDGPTGSSLGMIRQPNAQTGLAGDPNLQLPQIPAQIPTDPAELQKMGMGLMETVQAQMEANPDAIQSLPPEQQAMIKKYLDIAARASKGDRSVMQELDPKQIREDSKRLKELANQ